jgi:hypothetical protein
MKIDPVLQAHISEAFTPLDNTAAIHAFPSPAALSNALTNVIGIAPKVQVTKNVSQDVAKMFTTAAVNIWMRGVHSFLISASLTEVSPVWASVTGYYSSHYAIRALAHLLGFFQLYARKRIVQLQLRGGHYVCTFDPKKADQREHRFYWRIVKNDQHFAPDPFFTDNDPTPDKSDVAHRDRANYTDHLPHLPVFRPLDAVALKCRVERISDIEVISPPIPLVSRYPDIESIQIVAYHRLVRFRDLVDAIVGARNRFWAVHRNPPWAREFMDFQMIEESKLSQFTLS